MAVPKARRARGSETILLIEDDDAVRALAKVSLEYSGYTVLDAGNADVAIKICQKHPGRIHLLLTDIVMPDVNGPKLAEILLSIRKELKVLYMSGYTDDSIARSKLVAGAPFLQKPFAPPKLAEKVREVLDQAS
ncbi:MAG TPA: response regulator [Blastocatellia bacterium]